MQQKTKEDVLHVRLDKRQMGTVKELAHNVYGFDTTSEFMRYVIEHINKSRPVLGKSFAPERMNT